MEGEDASLALTAAGLEHAERLLDARRELLRDALADESADRDPEVTALLRRLARELCGEPPTTAAAAVAA
jgi:DNA-binding MarR family transcriptional regulator